jgi:carbon monoxide dehydrogenase subunit G
MRITDEFAISLAPDRVYERLLDLEQVAPCVPGGEIDTPDADGVYPGRVTVKLGPMRFTYAGTVRIVERDRASRRAVLRGAGQASGGAERAAVTTTMEVVPEGDGSRVRMTTDLDIHGRAAQMGAGIIGAVSRHMVRQAATCLEARLAAADEASGRPSTKGGQEEAQDGTS